MPQRDAQAEVAQEWPAAGGDRVHVLAQRRPAVVGGLVAAGEVPEGDAPATPGQGIGTVVVCAPGESDRLACVRARSGKRVLPPGPVSAGERGVERTEDSGP